MMVRARSEAVDACPPSAHPRKISMAAEARVNPAASSLATASGCWSGPSGPGPSRRDGGDVALALGDVEARAVEVVNLPRHRLDPAHQLLRRGEPHEGGGVLQPVVGIREHLSLRVVHHLQTVLDAPQQQVGVAQSGRLPRHDVWCSRSSVSSISSRRGPRRRAVAAAVGELMHVHEELDLADAAAAQLHVMAGRANRAVAVEVVNLLAHRPNLLHRGEVQRLVPDER